MTRHTRRTIPLTLLVASVCGTVAVFLPFAWSTSPLDAMSDSQLWRLGAPYFLAVAVGVLALHLVVTGALSALERAAALALAAGAAAVTASLYANGFLITGEDWSEWRTWMAFSPPFMLVGGALMLLALHRRRAPADLVAVAALVLAPLPNSVYLLSVFAGEWQIGAWFACAAATGYAIAGWWIWGAARGGERLPDSAIIGAGSA